MTEKERDEIMNGLLAEFDEWCKPPYTRKWTRHLIKSFFGNLKVDSHEGLWFKEDFSKEFMMVPHKEVDKAFTFRAVPVIVRRCSCGFEYASNAYKQPYFYCPSCGSSMEDHKNENKGGEA